MARRMDLELRVTFFSFQDIMMCVTGIMVIIALLLLIINCTGVASPGASEASPRNVTAAARADEDIALLSDRLKALQTREQALSASLAAQAGIDSNAMQRRLEQLQAAVAGQSRRHAAVDQDRQDLARLLEQVREQRKQIELAILVHERAFDAARLQANRLIVNVPAGEAHRRVIVQADKESILVGPMDRQVATAVIRQPTLDGRLADMARAVGELTTNGELVLLLVKPSAFEQYDSIMQKVASTVGARRLGSRPIAESSWIIRAPDDNNPGALP